MALVTRRASSPTALGAAKTAADRWRVVPFLKRPAAEPARLPPGTRVYAIGDVHGEAALLAQLLRRIADDARARGPADTVLLFLGDIIDRGPRGAELIDALTKATGGRVVLLKGNHEAAMVEAWRGEEEALAFWLEFGGRETLAGFGVEIADGDDLVRIGDRLRAAVPEALIERIDALPTSWTLGDYFFAHAGVRPGVPLDRQIEPDLLWIREPFLSSRRRHEKVIVHGHTVEPGVPALGGVRIGLDTGAAALGRLTALGLEDDRQWLLQATRDAGAASDFIAETAEAA